MGMSIHHDRRMHILCLGGWEKKQPHGLGKAFQRSHCFSETDCLRKVAGSAVRIADAPCAQMRFLSIPGLLDWRFASIQ